MEASKWVWSHGPEQASERLVLLALADWADKAGTCWPSMTSIAKRACVDERSARRIIRRLEKSGHIATQRGTGRNGCSVYQLRIDRPDAEESTTRLAKGDSESPGHTVPRTQDTQKGDSPVRRTIKNHHSSREEEASQQLVWQRLSAASSTSPGILTDLVLFRPPHSSKSVVQRPTNHVEAALTAYHEAAVRVGWPKVQKLTTQRRTTLEARLREAGGLEGWRAALAKAEASDFLCGRAASGRPFCASFDFLTRASSFLKLMEGNYDNRPDPSQLPGGSGRLARVPQSGRGGWGSSLASIVAGRRARGEV